MSENPEISWARKGKNKPDRDKQTTDSREDHSVKFLLAEYHRLLEAFQKVEESGERPVNFFIGLTTVLVGALLAFMEEEILMQPTVFVVGLTVLLLFGLTTLVRIIKRNTSSHEYLRAAGRIRKYFTDEDPKILDYVYFEPVDDEPFREKKWKELHSLGTGGLLENVTLVNSLIVAGIGGLLAYSYVGISAGILLALVGAIGAWIGQFSYVKGRYEHEKRCKQDRIKFPTAKGK